MPPKLVQFVCCRLSSVQTEIYDAILNTKEVRHIREGKQTNTLETLRHLINVCSHPKLILDIYEQKKLQSKEGLDEVHSFIY